MTPVSRTEWGAKYGRGTLDPGAEPRVVIHHSYKPALPPSASSVEEVAAVRAIERFHVETNRWVGIGYNWLVAPSCRIYEGRGWQYKGSHAGPVNGSSIGICLLIDGSVTVPASDLIQTVRTLIEVGLALGEISEDYTVSGHRDHMTGRTCPGDKVYARLQEFRHDASATADDKPVAPVPGERRWSESLGQWVYLVVYDSDVSWKYVTEKQLLVLPTTQAGTPWSKMPVGP